MRNSLSRFCAAIGQDALLVQGAGGNVSWKSGDELWIKASGTRLADAATSDIFVPVDLRHLSAALRSGHFETTPKVLGGSDKRPSIETTLHALMPFPVVVHLHPVEIVAHLVRDVPSPAELLAPIGHASPPIRQALIAYAKPGSSLTALTASALASASTNDPNVLMLQNHGVVIGAETVDDVRTILRQLCQQFRGLHANVPATPAEHNLLTDSKDGVPGYHPIEVPELHALATHPALYERVMHSWAICPDHVVFLGAEPRCYAQWNDFVQALQANAHSPELAFIENVGVWVPEAWSRAQLAQLQFFHDIVVRQPSGQKLRTLNIHEIGELLNWDAEIYRQQLNRQ